MISDEQSQRIEGKVFYQINSITFFLLLLWCYLQADKEGLYKPCCHNPNKFCLGDPANLD